ncbi:ThuA domain-containing protein [Pseudolysinimonas yzui]|uniref:Trehalose utilization protein ThuA n=1 Tax=Pseudolysinimonas yzui TaxID=2708254 RepID=A0A8J3GTB2_9MICO|nr:ThuA domain-containing protein [Pseudolysinimonas yzui]GHF26587.1 trehalose utilization protein ThuA [Pseudolysinimonas yzui]
MEEIMQTPIRVTVWGENVHEDREASVREIYPDTMHETIAAGIREHLGEQTEVRTAWLQQPEHGLTEEVLAETDVLTWWGHAAHDEVSDEVVARVHQAVLSGMGLLVLHSGHFSKIFIRLMGTTCSLDWRSADDQELIWTVAPGHPIAEGVPHPLVIEREEMYGEHFDVPQPDELVFISSFGGGEVFRSGCAYRRGRGRVFYFRPGDQDFPTYHQPGVKRIISNAVRWLAPGELREAPNVHHRPMAGWFNSP